MVGSLIKFFNVPTYYIIVQITMHSNKYSEYILIVTTHVYQLFSSSSESPSEKYLFFAEIIKLIAIKFGFVYFLWS